MSNEPMEPMPSTAIVRAADSAAIELTADTVKRYVNPHANNQEIALFLNQCVMFGLNPFKREIYLIKYADNEPATFVVGYESYLKRAERSGKWGGMESGTTDDANGKPITAWVKVYRRDWERPLIHEVYFDEYCQYRDEYKWIDGKRQKTGQRVPTKFWAEKPRTMLKKVAIAQAIRMAFPDEIGGMPYTAEEMPVEHEKLPTAEIATISHRTADRPPAAPLPRVRDEFDPYAPETAVKTPSGPATGPSTPPPAAAPANPVPPPVKRGPGRPAKPKPEPAAAKPTDDPNDPNWKAPFDDEPEPAAPASDQPAGDPDKLAELKTAITKLRDMGVSEEKIYIGINRNLVANKQMVIAELGDLDNTGIGVALAYVNKWRHGLMDERAKAEKNGK